MTIQRQSIEYLESEIFLSFFYLFDSVFLIVTYRTLTKRYHWGDAEIEFRAERFSLPVKPHVM